MQRLAYTKFVTADTTFLPLEDALAINAGAKVIRGDVEWRQMPDKNSNVFHASFVVFNQKSETIPGQCKYLYTVYTLVGATTKRRSFQVEVVPPDRIKHRENGVAVSGPHQHVAEKFFPVDDDARNLGCAHCLEWFNYFCRKTNISHEGGFFEPDPPHPQTNFQFL